LIPAAIPLCSVGTTLRATSATTGLRRPTPAPKTRKPPSRVVHSDPALTPDIKSRPTPATASAALIKRRAGTCDRRAPASGAARKLTTVRGR
jgi:hypothetical protein